MFETKRHEIETYDDASKEDKEKENKDQLKEFNNTLVKNKNPTYSHTKFLQFHVNKGKLKDPKMKKNSRVYEINTEKDDAKKDSF